MFYIKPTEPAYGEIYLLGYTILPTLHFLTLFLCYMNSSLKEDIKPRVSSVKVEVAPSFLFTDAITS